MYIYGIDTFVDIKISSDILKSLNFLLKKKKSKQFSCFIVRISYGQEKLGVIRSLIFLSKIPSRKLYGVRKLWGAFVAGTLAFYL